MREIKEKLPCLYREDNRRPIEYFSREVAVRQRPIADCMSIYGSKEHWAAFLDTYSLTCLGPRVFWKKVRTVNATYKNGRLYGTLDVFRNKLLEIFNLNWISSNDWTIRLLANKKDLWRDIFSNKITNPEILCKTISRRYFKGAYSYKTLREMAKGYSSTRISLWDLYYHTTNPEETLKLILNPCCPIDIFTLEDIIDYCKILNTKFNPLWSVRRMQEEHQKQIELVNMQKIEKFSDTPITTPYASDGLSLILDERTCFVEGTKMHNCVHSCYWRQITSGIYLIARGEVNGEYIDLGISVASSYAVFQQAHTIRNGAISIQTKKLCEEWINSRQKELVNIALQIRNTKITDNNAILPF